MRNLSKLWAPSGPSCLDKRGSAVFRSNVVSGDVL